MSVYCVYLLCIYINTNTCMYIFKKHVMFIYYIYLYIKYNSINVYTCIYIFKIYTVCVSIYIYIINKHSTQKLLFWMWLIVWQH